jgi:hypothetical protein
MTAVWRARILLGAVGVVMVVALPVVFPSIAPSSPVWY